MTSITVRELELEAFQPYGTFCQMADNPRIMAMAPRPVIFRPDMIQMQLGDSTTASFSICRVEPREFVITGGEYHDRAMEGILPLDGDILIHVAPPTHPRVGIPVDSFEVYRVPMGTMVVLRPGAWHGAPYAAGDSPVNVLVVLPVRTYAMDSVSVRLESDQQIPIVGV
jgi:ureidoglycolate lyase